MLTATEDLDITACGEDVRLVADPSGIAEQTSVKQEPNISPRH
ncbi:MAG: hypothetical protein RTU30_00375 [Candidatus Thorarchaeota archaeon]